MDVLIKNTRLPETCNQCFFTRHCDAHARQVQKMKESKHEQVFDVFGEMRLDDCPLIEVKPHGRLIDAEKVKDNIYKHHLAEYRWNKDIELTCRILDDAPTVLEASNVF